MNLHEECLLKFLLQPDNLSETTDLLKLNNLLLEKKSFLNNFVAKNKCLNYTVK